MNAPSAGERGPVAPASIIIVNYNGKDFIKECLDSLMASEASKEEIIAVDNASTDGSPELIKNTFPFVRLIALEKNIGFAGANNIGAKAASGRYIVFLNPDTVVTAGWLKHLLDVLQSDISVGVAGSKLLLMDDRVNSAGANIVATGGAYDIGFMDTDSDKYNKPGPRGAVSGAALIVRRDEFLSMGGFDPFYFMYFEDVDLCLRYWLSGRKVLYAPRSVVYHRFGGSAGDDRFSPLRVFYGYRNALLNAIKHFETGNLIKALALSIPFHAVSFVLLILRLRPAGALAVLRAYGSVIGHLPEVIEKRRALQKARKVPDGFLFENSLIVSLKTAADEFMRLKRLRK